MTPGRNATSVYPVTRARALRRRKSPGDLCLDNTSSNTSSNSSSNANSEEKPRFVNNLVQAVKHDSLLVVLRGAYDPYDRNLALLKPRDRAKFLAVRALMKKRYGQGQGRKYRLQGYMVAVDGTQTTNPDGTVERLRATIVQAVDFEGNRRKEIENIDIKEECVLQRGAFQGVKEVSDRTTITLQRTVCSSEFF